METQATTTVQNPAVTGTQAQDAAQIAATAAAQTGTQAPEPVQLTRAEYDALLADRNGYTELRQRNRTAEEQAEQARIQTLVAKGESTQALSQQQERFNAQLKAEQDRALALQDRMLTRERSLAINDALAGTEWVSPSAAIQARQLLESRFEAVLDPATSQVQVLDRNTRRPAGDVAKEWLGSQDAAHFLKSRAGKGTSTGGQHGGASTNDEPLSYEGQVMANWQQRQDAAQQAGWQLPIQRTLRPIN